MKSSTSCHKQGQGLVTCSNLPKYSILQPKYPSPSWPGILTFEHVHAVGPRSALAVLAGFRASVFSVSKLCSSAAGAPATVLNCERCESTLQSSDSASLDRLAARLVRSNQEFAIFSLERWDRSATRVAETSDIFYTD